MGWGVPSLTHRDIHTSHTHTPKWYLLFIQFTSSVSSLSFVYLFIYLFNDAFNRHSRIWCAGLIPLPVGPDKRHKSLSCLMTRGTEENTALLVTSLKPPCWTGYKSLCLPLQLPEDDSGGWGGKVSSGDSHPQIYLCIDLHPCLSFQLRLHLMRVTSASLASLLSPAQLPQPTRLTGPYGLDVSLPPYYSVLGVLLASRAIAIFRCLRDSMGEALGHESCVV